MNFEPRRIKRIGIAVEMEDGERFMLFSDSPGIEVELERDTEYATTFGSGTPRPIFTDRTLTVRHLNSYTISTSEPHIEHSLDSTRNAIENAKKIAGGNPK